MFFGKIKIMLAGLDKTLFDHSISTFTVENNFAVNSTYDRHSFANIVKVDYV